VSEQNINGNPDGSTIQKIMYQMTGDIDANRRSLESTNEGVQSNTNKIVKVFRDIDVSENGNPDGSTIQRIVYQMTGDIDANRRSLESTNSGVKSNTNDISRVSERSGTNSDNIRTNKAAIEGTFNTAFRAYLESLTSTC